MPDTSLTPMLQQYEYIKAEHQDKLLLFRLGDFYELFGQDAEIAARELEITLTSRDAGKAGRIPMCGVPYHAADTYIGRLVSRGYKVAICEQVEDPRLAKGLVRREVIRVVTPGTVLETSLLDEKSNNYLAAVSCEQRSGKALAAGLAFCDPSTGEFLVTEIRGDRAYEQAVSEILKKGARECLVPVDMEADHPIVRAIMAAGQITLTYRDTGSFEVSRARKELLSHFKAVSLNAFGCEEMPLALSAAGACLNYLFETQKSRLSYINRLQTYSIQKSMILDQDTGRNLELYSALRGGSKKGSLLGVLDRTVTAMGGRLMRRWLQEPSLDLDEIKRRQDLVQIFFDDQALRNNVREILKGIYDLERLTARASAGLANPRELWFLGASLGRLPELARLLADVSIRFDCLEDVADKIRQCLVDDPPASLNEGGIIRPGFNERLDQFRDARTQGKSWIARLEASEKERTGIKSLKVGYNQVFGYYIEVTKPNLHLVPENYIRKQTLSSAERFITPELKEIEVSITNAEEQELKLESELFSTLRDEVASQAPRLQEAAGIVAEIDVVSALAEVARVNDYTRPDVTDGDEIVICGARHPVVEHFLKDSVYVPNDVMLDTAENQIAIITGPNMAGKSTYMRSVALAVIMAQMGSFVAARKARIGLVDRIMTRIGATDDVALGLSTFMVEMLELSRILANAGRRSLILLDEIGRGTGTLDGLSIATATIEYIHDKRRVGAKTLFATHFHQLTRLEKTLPRVKNYCMTAKQEGQDIVFLHKIERGGTSESYGIDVARLAGLPSQVIERAREILQELKDSLPGEPGGIQKSGRRGIVGGNAANLATNQLALFVPVEDTILRELEELDIERLTPLDALMKLKEFQDRLRERELGVRVTPRQKLGEGAK